MSEEGGAEMPAAAAPLDELDDDDDDFLGEILPRLSPLTSSLPRASVVSRLPPPVPRPPPNFGRELVFSSVLPSRPYPRERFSLRFGDEKYDAFSSCSLLGASLIPYHQL